MRLVVLDLGWCDQLTNAGLEVIRGMPLEGLSLTCCSNLTPAALDCLQGMPLAKLQLYGAPLLVGLSWLFSARAMNLEQACYIFPTWVAPSSVVASAWPVRSLHHWMHT